MRSSRQTSCSIVVDLHHWLSLDQDHLTCGLRSQIVRLEHNERNRNLPTRQTHSCTFYLDLSTNHFQRTVDSWSMVTGWSTSHPHAHEVQHFRWNTVQPRSHDKGCQQDVTFCEHVAQYYWRHWWNRTEGVSTFLSGQETFLVFLDHKNGWHHTTNDAFNSERLELGRRLCIEKVNCRCPDSFIGYRHDEWTAGKATESVGKGKDQSNNQSCSTTSSSN